MFCPKCGNQIADGALFCPVCGATLNAPARSAEPEQYQQPVQQYQQPVQQPYQQPAQQPYQQPMQYQYQQNYQYQQPMYGYNPSAAQQERMQSMQEMDRMREYFSQKANEYSEYDAINATLDEYDKRRPGLLVWGIILFVIGFFMTVAFISEDVGAGGIVFSIFMMLGATGMILAFIFGSASRKKNKESALYRLVQLADELHTHFVNYGYCPVGEEFTNPAILSRIGDNLRTGRANTIQEAINIMFDDAHKTQMEYAAMETMHSARQAAAGATTAAVFAAANFFLR